MNTAPTPTLWQHTWTENNVWLARTAWLTEDQTDWILHFRGTEAATNREVNTVEWYLPKFPGLTLTDAISDAREFYGLQD